VPYALKVLEGSGQSEIKSGKFAHRALGDLNEMGTGFIDVSVCKVDAWILAVAISQDLYCS